MFDSLTTVSTALSGGLGTTVNSTAINLGATSTSPVGGHQVRPLQVECTLPSNPTGTTPSIQITLQDEIVTNTWVDRTIVRQTDAVATGFPKQFRAEFIPRKGAMRVRVKFVLANTDNVYGTVVTKLGFAGNRDTGSNP